MNCIIDFVYTFDCELDENNLTDLSELIATAEYFCFFPLVDHCAKFMMTILNHKNCIALMQTTRFAFHHSTIRKFTIFF